MADAKKKAAIAKAHKAIEAKLKFVSECHLKKREHKLKKKVAIKKKKELRFNLHKKERVEIFKRAESYVKEYRAANRDLIRRKRQAKDASRYFIPAESKVLLVVRIRGIMRMHPMTKKILQLFRLRQIHNAVFLKVNKATLNMLKKIEAYVTYGAPNLKTISDMIYKRGFGKVKGQRIPISSNGVICGELRKYNIICVEDLIHEIYTVGPNFKEANNFLWPFKLASPNGGYKKKRIHYSEGGQAGNREEDINKFVRRMN